MRRSLPSLLALESFEAVARLGSVTRAAEELGRTQSAVSRQLANLEQFVRRPLFDRARKRMVVNDAGRMFQGALAGILNQLEAEVDRLVGYGAGDAVLRVGVLPTFGMRWLVPRLGDFAIRHQDVAISLVTGVGPFDLDGSKLDIAIQHGSGDWPGVRSHRLFGEEIVAVIAPHVVQPGADIADYEWLQMATRPWLWQEWLRDRPDDVVAAHGSGTTFENFGMVIEAAANGIGVAILPTLYIADELASGRLTAPFGPPIASTRGYYLVESKDESPSAKIEAFREWLLRTAHPDAG